MFRIAFVSLSIGASAAALALACGSSDSGGSGNGSTTSNTNGGTSTNSSISSTLSEQENEACSTAPTIVTGTDPEGTACTSAKSCAPVCCTCDSGVGSWSAASCQGTGTCSQNTACDDTRASTLHTCGT